MQRLLFIFLAVLVVGQTKAQTAIIKDPDGFCNIRHGASNQSRVVDTLSNGRIVFALDEGAEGNWLSIDYKKGTETHSAYVHKSRVTFLNSLPKFKTVTHNDSLLKLQFDTFQIIITSRKFSAKGRQIQYEKPQGEEKYIKYIDQKFPWGTDGNLPRHEYKAIQLKAGGKTLAISSAAFGDLFEPNLDQTAAYIDKETGKIYIEASNSDAAGAYVVIWTIKAGQMIGRETFIPF